MRRTLLVCIGAIGVAACDSGGDMRAGPEAAKLGIVEYEVSTAGDTLTIAMVGADRAVLGAIDVSRIDETLEVAGETVHFNVQTRLRDVVASEITGSTIKSVVYPGDVFERQLDPATGSFVAVLTDPALAPVLAERGLVFVVGEMTQVGPGGEEEVAFDSCHFSYGNWGWPTCVAQYCTQSNWNGQTEDETIPNSCTCTGGCNQGAGYSVWAYRHCDTSCQGGPPSPCGAPYGQGGCYVSDYADTWNEVCGSC